MSFDIDELEVYLDCLDYAMARLTLLELKDIYDESIKLQILQEAIRNVGE